MIKMIFSNAVLRVPVLFATAAGAVVTIAGGYWAIYKVVTFIGN